ncbi:hypothetical protein COT82_01145 [Candidatus Campbellbacteria bacterium CG10_big_fil_rev_8_21_14_0_10_35_52]|uniref:Uncharacterized protein n=1 Tax=Candidatus Campbellbacteria bacterium CG10_big_fil_rev_8_21_14_0_10_35_52 TaxID=1974527 RepID=A0A2M6WVW1_9BACT|nr:MAG: hypothetical protein COT82_01145 [Candidatus Campbellbacteria bacterium CG10_big_fil_rev_8_21_14_0_10_35_52]
MSKFEKINQKINLPDNIDTIDKQKEEIQNRIEIMSEDFNLENIPVDNECRMLMEAYKNTYASEELIRDLKYIEEKEKLYANRVGMGVEEWKKSKNKRDGERFEQLKTIIFNRNFKDPNIIAVRASEYDDYKNGIDNIIVNKKTGQVICAFDEITDDTKSRRYKEKEEKIKEINENGGATLKYGLTFEDSSDGPKPVLKEIKKVSIFILSLSRRELYEEIKNFEKSGKREKDLFANKFGKQAIEQLRNLPSYVSQELKEQWMHCF